MRTIGRFGGSVLALTAVVGAWSLAARQASGLEIRPSVVLVNEMSRRNLLHEMGHIWIDQNVSRVERDRFLEFRGLRTWNAPKADWGYRGYEQGAEILAWALGDRTLTAQIPDNDPIQLAAGFELLTGVRTPTVV